MFYQGACTVWADQELVAAIPASNEDSEKLADLMDVAVVGLENRDSLTAYKELRDALCGELGYQRLTLLFKMEMEKEQKFDESSERASKLACAARPKTSRAPKTNRAPVPELPPLTATNRIQQKGRKYILIAPDGKHRLLGLVEIVMYKCGWKGADDFQV
jgi:hypothetical protein